MNKQNRRTFLQTSAAALGASFSGVVGVTRNPAPPHGPGTNFLRTQQTAPTVASNEGKKPLRLGLIIAIGGDPDASMAKVHDLGIPTTQVFVEEFELSLVARLRQAQDKYQIEATSRVVGGPGKEVWDFYHGPLTIGLVPREMREVTTYCKRNGQNFRYETGQETPITLVRAIQDVGADNQGVNFDLANLILYGKANPVDGDRTARPVCAGNTC